MTATFLTDYQNRVIAKFWRRMTGLYESRWTSKYGTVPTVKSEWIDLLCNLSAIDIQRGLKICQDRKKYWPPTVLEFKDACLDISPVALGLPDLDQAFYQAITGNYKKMLLSNEQPKKQDYFI